MVAVILMIMASFAFAQEDAFSRADAAYAQGNWSAARQEYERIVEIYPGTASAWLRLALIHEELGNWTDAVANYEMLATLGPVSRDTRMAYGDALRSVGRLEDALVQYELAVHEAPVMESVDKSLGRARSAFESGDLGSAGKIYEELTRNYPGHPTAWLGLARIHARLAQWDAAVEAFAQLEQLGPLGKELRLEYGDALRGAGRLEEGIAQYNMAVGLPMSPELTSTASLLPEAVSVKTVDAAHLEEQDRSRPQRMLLVPGQEERSVEAANARLEALISQDPLLPETAAVDNAPAVAETPTIKQPDDDWQAFDPAAASFRSSRIEDLPGEDAQSIMSALLPPSAASESDSGPAGKGSTGEFTKPFEAAGRSTDKTSDRTAAAAGEDSSKRNTSAFFKVAEINTLQSSSDGSTSPAPAGGQMDWLATARSHFLAEEWSDCVLAFENHIDEVGDENLESAIRLEYALALLEDGQTELAEENISLVLHQEPDNTEAKIALAKLLSRTGELNDSMLLLDQLRMDDTSKTEVRLARIYGYFHNDYIQETLMDLGELIATNPANEDIREMVATGAPWTEVKPLLEARPGNERIIDMVETVKTRLLSQMDIGEADIANIAMQMYESGEYESARADFEQKLMDDPADATSWRGLAVLTLVAKDYSASIAAWESYLELMPGDTAARLSYAQTLTNCDCNQALCELWAIIALGEPANEAGKKLYEFQPGVTAIPQDAIVDSATYQNALLSYAVALSVCERGKESLYWYRQAMYWQPDNMHWQSYYAGALSGLGRYEDAIGIYCSLLKQDPAFEPAMLGKGYTFAAMGQFKDAFRLWDSIPVTSSYYTAGRIAKGYGLFWNGERSDAMAMACYAMKTDPESCEVWDLLRAIKDIPSATLTVDWRQSHDSEDNDLRAVTTTLTVPLDARGSSMIIDNEEFKVDNTLAGQESSGERTGLSFMLPVNDHQRFQVLARYLDVDNGLDGRNDKWDWGASFSIDHGDERSYRFAYDSRMFYETPELSRTAVVMDEYSIGTSQPFDSETKLIASFAYGDLSDGNNRVNTDWRLQRERNFWGQGQLVYGLHFVTLDYCKDLNNGYWDPNNYYFGEIYADWIDQSGNDFLWDFGMGYGWDDAADRSPGDVLRYQLGMRTKLFNDRMTMRAGYSNSELATLVTTGPGYRYELWQLTGQVQF
jgi:tetratricopeptide (TPR) repeat protein